MLFLEMKYMAFVARGNVVEHINARIGRGNEKQRNHGHRQRSADLRPGQLRQKNKQQFFRLPRQRAQSAAGHMLVKPDGAVAENREPQHRKQAGNHQHAKYKLAHRAPARNSVDRKSVV